jgi:hypothetical protein
VTSPIWTACADAEATYPIDAIARVVAARHDAGGLWSNDLICCW